MSRPWILFFALVVAGWVAAGIVFLVPWKVRLMRRVGRLLSVLQIIALARAGDPEAQALKKASGVYLLVGAGILVAEVVVRNLV